MKKNILIALLFISSPSIFGQQLIDKVPIKLIDNLIFMEVRLNNSTPLNFMFDTGAGVTVINTATANQLQLPISKEIKIGTSGKTILSKISENNELLISEKFKIDSVTVALMDLSHISEYFKAEIDGIIGIDLLNETILETNMDSMEIRFFSISDYTYSGQAEPLKLIGLESNHLGLPIEIVPKGKKESIALIIKIDTAADNYLTFHNQTVTKYNLIDPKKRYKTKKGFGADATITRNLGGKISSATFGTKKWKNIPVVYEVDKLNTVSDRQADGLIGQAMLLAFNITYNMSNGTIFLEKRK
jgi:hypothetical protein